MQTLTLNNGVTMPALAPTQSALNHGRGGG